MDLSDIRSATATENGSKVSKAEERGNWGSSREFLLSCIAMSVGLGNLWRFPYVCLQNGGGAFLIPYIIMLTFIGRPGYYLEMIMGQYSSKSSVRVFDCVPAMRGVGLGQVMAMFTVSCFYAAIMAISLRYFVYSLIGFYTGSLPWETCNPAWNVTCINASSDETINDSSTMVSTAAYFIFEVNNDHFLIIFLVFSWLIVFITQVNGVSTFGKVSYLTSIGPYVFIFILLIRVLTLDGAFEGIAFFFTPDLAKILEPKVWYEAALQCFYSLNIYFACVVMYASFNKFNHNISRDAHVISIVDTLTSLLAGIITFAVVGHICKTVGYDINDEKTLKSLVSGPPLAFITYPLAFAKFPYFSTFFTALFFLMFYILGLGSNLSMISSIVTVICDEFKMLPNWLVSLGYTIIAIIGGFLFVQPGGLQWINLVENFGIECVIFFLAVCELIAFCHIYGVDQICLDVQLMLGRKPHKFYIICWKYITPSIMTAIFFGFVYFYEVPLNDGAPYSKLAYTLGISMATIFLSMLPICMICEICISEKETIIEKMKDAFKPHNWGPRLPENRALCGLNSP